MESIILFFKVLISYFVEIELVEVDSEYSEFLVVSLNRGQYQLSTSRAIYSYGKHYYNYGQVFQKLYRSKPPVKKVLVLGYGLGSIPQLLSKYYKELDITGVEIDEAVLELNEEFGYKNENYDFHFYAVDALEFVQHDDNKYDLIAIDIFVQDYIPEEFESEAFMQNIKSLLTENGTVIFNRLQFTKPLKEGTKKYYGNTFSKVFPSAKAIPIKGNVMLVNK